MKTLKFRDGLVKKITEGEKTSTWRLFDDKNLQAGDETAFVNSETGEEFARAVLTDVREKKLGEIRDSDFEGNERFESQEKMYEIYKNYYGSAVNADTVVKIIKFKLLK